MSRTETTHDESAKAARGLAGQEAESVDRPPRLRPTVVRASAGTGKTYQLTARLLQILLQGAEPDSILATTFTRKAAGEILDRLLLTLARAADPADPEALEQIRQQVGAPHLPRGVCLRLLRELLASIHRLRVCTLDSLFTQLARALLFELDLPPNWRLTDEIEEAWLTERAVGEMIRHLQSAEITAWLSMLGKGEVRRSVARELIGVVRGVYAQQRRCGPDVWDRLVVPTRPEAAALTRTAGEFRQTKLRQNRLTEKLENLAEFIEAGDFQSLAEDTLVANIAKARRAGEEVKYGRSKFPDSLAAAFETLYAAARQESLSLLRAQNRATGELLAAYEGQISPLKQTQRTLGFDDVAVRLADHFASLDPEQVAERIDVAIDHLLLDEFQDTSPIQWQVLRPLALRAADATHDERRVHRSFFCVGDTKQAIYGWRGGVAEIFDAVSDEVPGVETSRQDTSYRSSPTVIEFVNRVFKNLARHPLAHPRDESPTEKACHEARAVREFADSFPLHRAHRRSLPGHVSLVTTRRPEGDRAAVTARHLDDAAESIAACHRQAPGRSIGVLTRTNRCVAELIDRLETLDVPVSQEGGNPLTDSAAVEAILSALMMTEHPGDGRWHFHVLATPLAGYLADGRDRSPATLGRRLRRLIEHRGLTEAIEELAAVMAPVCDRRDTLRLRQLIGLALQYQPNATPRLRDFVRLVREKRVERPQAAPVRVMTVHQAKGLEFDAVVLPELDGPLTRPSGHCVPDVRRLGDPPYGLSRYLSSKSWHFLPDSWLRAFGNQTAAGLTESLCLLYVALTRARQSLQLVIQPARHADFNNRTPSSLIFHALGLETDPRSAGTTLFESGDADWFRGPQESEPQPVEPTDNPAAPPPVSIAFQPLPPVPRRNCRP